MAMALILDDEERPLEWFFMSRNPERSTEETSLYTGAVELDGISNSMAVSLW
jgi:hypothetical protein